MARIATVIGARPQIIKAAAISRAIGQDFPESLKEIIIHTGQHYDDNMSEVFFRQLGVPQPDYNLQVGSGPHGQQTAKMLEGLERIFTEIHPDFVLVYGDTNSTLAGAIAAAKLHIPIAHVEAGLRSFNKSMPEEINRIVCDHLSTLLFCPTRTGVNNLLREGFREDREPPYHADNPRVFHCGDVMYDNSLFFAETAARASSILADHKLERDGFVLATIHRDNNTDDPVRLNTLFSALDTISRTGNLDVVLPLHPRTAKMLKENLTKEMSDRLAGNARLRILPPASFFDMIVLEKNCRLVMTDSGGVQKEGYFFRKPCIILRSETEWTEITDAGAGIVTDADEERILTAFEHFTGASGVLFPQVFGDGHAGVTICREILKATE